MRREQEQGAARIGNTGKPCDELTTQKTPALRVALGRAPAASPRSTVLPIRPSRGFWRIASPQRNAVASIWSQLGLVRHFRVTLLLISLACPGPALAGPREDSLARVSRCSTLPDDRTFLDCVYGAMQPMRAALGLPPALPAQQRLVPADPSLARSIPPAGVPAAAPAGSIQPAPAKESGMLSNVFSGGALHMASYSFDRRGLFTVTLSDGSVWRQDSNDTNFAHFAGKASSYSVDLHPADYGKARIDVRGEGGPYLVVRVQ